MTREAARKIIAEMQQYYSESPYPGGSPDSVKFFEQKANQLQWAIDFNLELDSLLNWVRIFYSPRRWQQWDYDQIRGIMHEAIDKVGMRIGMAPDRVFDSTEMKENG